MKKLAALINPQFEAFMAVAKHKSVHAAARAINISQTAATQRILLLEQRLRITLFIRTTQGMQLTPEGEKLLRFCHTMTDYTHETLGSIHHAGIHSSHRIIISGPASIMSSRITPVCMPIMRSFPQLYFTFNVNDTDDIVHALRTGRSHFAILRPDQVTSDMEIKKLQPEKYLLVCSKHWKDRNIVDILQSERIIDFDETDQTSFNYLRHYKLIQHAQPERLFVNRNDSLTAMLIAGFGYGVLTKEFSEPYLQSGDLITLNQSKTFNNPLCLAWYPRPDPPQYFAAVINFIN